MLRNFGLQEFKQNFGNKWCVSLPRATEFLLLGYQTFNDGASAGSTILYEHEKGTNQVRNLLQVQSSAIASSIESGDFDLDIDGDGEYFMEYE